MKLIFTIFSLLIINKNFCQCSKNQNFESILFCKKLDKKNDTIYFKAIFKSIGKIVQSDYINLLNSKKIINKKKYTSAISFVPIGTTQELYLPFNDFYNKKNYEKLNRYTNQNQIICIRGIVYRGYEKWHTNIFFLVDRIDFIDK